MGEANRGDEGVEEGKIGVLALLNHQVAIDLNGFDFTEQLSGG